MDVRDRLELLLDAGSSFDQDEATQQQWKYSGVDQSCIGKPCPITKEEKELVSFMGGNYNRELARLYFEKRPVTVMTKFAKMMKEGAKVIYEWKRQEKLPREERTRGRILRKAINELGPAFIKCGQTMSARSDLIGQEAAVELAELQNNTEPFSSELAMKNMADSFQWDGPIAPGIKGPWKGNEEDLEMNEQNYLFKSLSKEPIASASLGQVYKGETWEGDKVAVKVQRPEILFSLLLDMYVLRLGLVVLRALWGSDTDLTAIADEIAAGVWNELDYRQEAANAEAFAYAHRFLPYVKVPRYLMEYSTERVLTMEWCEGQKLGSLEPQQQMDFMAKAIETSGAMLLQTGLVHADPHEGNILYDVKTGDLVFIDFGLVSNVHPRLMEAFASGVINLITMDWMGFSKDFKDMELVPVDEFGNSAFKKYDPAKEGWGPCTIEDFCVMLGETVQNADMQDFGDLVFCVQQMADNYKFLCPPYTILLVRTFATLEGLAAKCDANFNMYEACLPYAVRRGLAPTTPEGKKELRNTLLNKKGQFAFENFQESIDLMERMQGQEEGTPAAAAGKNEEGANGSEDGEESSSNPDNRDEITKQITGRAPEIVGSLATAPEGSTLRQIMVEADTISFVDRVLSQVTREVQSKAVGVLASTLQEKIISQNKHELKLSKKPASAHSSTALKLVAGKHLNSLLSSGPRGLALLAKMVFISVKIAVSSSIRACLSSALLAVSLGFKILSDKLGSVANWITSA
jgi:predicted unusual protein kinase regulating ubiquinone biosynthesis (AarF/ABC1/UbiB family)